MCATVLVAGVASSLVLTTSGAVASVADDAGPYLRSSRAAPGETSVNAKDRVGGDRARRCIGKKKVRRARVFVTYKRLNRILGKKGTYWAGTYRVWDVCYSAYDLSAYVQKKKRKLRVYEIDTPLKGARARSAKSTGRVDSSRRCISKRKVKRRVRPYMTYRTTKKILGAPSRNTPTTAAWKGCFGALKLGFDRVKGKRRVRAINVISAS